MAKTIFVTGTNSGFGKAIVEFFANQNWNVAATVRNEEHLSMFSDFSNVKVYQLDITDFNRFDKVANQAIIDFGKIDVLVNNAGYCLFGALEATTLEQLKRLFETNVLGTYAMTKALIPHMRQNEAGMILNMSSLTAILNYPFLSGYGATKSALASINEALSVELAPFGIKVKTLLPGLHATKIFENIDFAAHSTNDVYAPFLKNLDLAQTSISFAAAPQKVAEVIWEIIKKNDDRRTYPINRDAIILSLFKNFIPEGIWKKITLNSIIAPPSLFQIRFLKWMANGTMPFKPFLSKSKTLEP